MGILFARYVERFASLHDGVIDAFNKAIGGLEMRFWQIHNEARTGHLDYVAHLLGFFYVGIAGIVQHPGYQRSY
jgi:hypothetical protein